jgi:hypothetical protein
MEGLTGQEFTQPDLVHLLDLPSTYSPECLLRNPLKETSEGFFVYSIVVLLKTRYN